MDVHTAISPRYQAMATSMGARKLRIANLPRDITNQLRLVYSTLLPTKRMDMENKWNKMWNPQMQIEQIKDTYTRASFGTPPPPYTEDQMTGKAKTSMEQCGLMPTALLE